MKRQNKAAFIVELAKMAEAVGESPSEARIEIYFEDLFDFPFEVVAKAIRAARKDSKWFPKIPELRALCNDEMIAYFPKEGRIGVDHQLSETVVLTEEQARQSRERIQALIRETKKKLNIEEERPENRAKKIIERKEFLKAKASKLKR